MSTQNRERHIRKIDLKDLRPGEECKVQHFQASQLSRTWATSAGSLLSRKFFSECYELILITAQYHVSRLRGMRLFLFGDVLMYIDEVPNRGSRPTILLRGSYRVGKRVLKHTYTNMTRWPQDLVDGIRVLLKGGKTFEDMKDIFDIDKSLPFGHVAAVVAFMRTLGLDRIIASRRSRDRDLVLAMIAARILDPGSKLATARSLDAETEVSALGDLLGLESTDENDLCCALDWLLARQPHIEKKLSRKHLSEGSITLYDVTSTYFEGRQCPLASRGHCRDKKKGKLQIVYGVPCNAQGCPVAVEVFPGNTGDPSTLSTQIEKIRNRFGLKHIVLVGDRGMITQARINEELRDREGLDWITALRGPAIAQLIEEKTLQPSLFDQTDLAEIKSPDYPDERLIACHNP
ncbi:transposase, partial [Thermodesulfobacteriota bacterium]